MDTISALAELWAPSLLFGMSACLLLAAVAVPFMSVAALAAALLAKRGLYDRCARQLGRLALALAWLAFACAGGLILTKIRQTAFPPLLADAGLAAGSALAVAAVLWSVCVRAWQRLRTRPAALCLLGLAGGLGAALVPVLALLLACMRLTGIDISAFSGWQDPLLPARLAEVGSGHLFLSLLSVLVPLGCAAGGGIALIWLVLRRKRDDYGRDYYAFAARWCGKWAAAGGWLSLALLACVALILSEGTFFSALDLNLGAHARGMAGAGLLAVAAALWTGIGLSAAPMRHKPGMVLALFCFLAELYASALC